MFALFIVLLDLTITGLGIYLFDYRFDGVINNVLVILLSILLGLLITAFTAWLLINIFYLLLPKNKIQKSMFRHKLLKQIVSVPIHFSGIRIKVIGKENLPKDTGFTIYSNHNSWMDPTLISYALYNNPVCALGKEGAFNIPVVGKLAPKFGCVMIHRSDPRQSAEAIKEVILRVKEGFTMIIFPEGTRNSRKDTLLGFKPGAFKVALRSERPIVPLTLVKSKSKFPFIKRVTLVIHKPLYFDDFKDTKTMQLSEEVKSIIASSLQSK